MDGLLLKGAEILISNGPLGIVLAFMVYRDFKRDKRLDYVTDQHMALSKETVEILSALKERLR